MKLETKKRIVLVWLMIMAVWPLVHRGLVVTYDISPWRFFGWAMYCVPKLDMRLDINHIHDGQPRELEFAGDFHKEVRHETRRYLNKRRIWGDFHFPDVLAYKIFEQRPEVQILEFVVHHPRLDTRTSYVVDRTRTYRYERSHAGWIRTELPAGP